MNDKFKAFLFAILILGVLFASGYLYHIPFLRTLILSALSLIFWNTEETKYPRLSGILPSSFTLKNTFAGLAIGTLFFLPYALMIFSDGFTISITSSYWPDLFFLADQSIVEELVFRGLLFFVLVKYFGEWKVTLAFAVLFMAAHLGNSNASVLGSFNTFLASVLIAAMAFVTKSLFMPVAFHLGWNLTQGSVLSLPVSGNQYPGLLYHSYRPDSLFFGGYYGPEEGLWCTLYLIAATVITIRYIKPSPENTSQWFAYTYDEPLEKKSLIHKLQDQKK